MTSAARKLEGLFAPTPRVLHFIEIPDPESSILDKMTGAGVKFLRPAARDIVADLIRRELSTRMCRQWDGRSWSVVAIAVWVKELRWSDRTIKRALRELERAGIIHRRHRHRRGRGGKIRELTAMTRLSWWARGLCGMPAEDGAGQLPLVGAHGYYRRSRDRSGPITIEQVRSWRDCYDILNKRGTLTRMGVTWRDFLADRLASRGAGALPAHLVEAVERSAAAPTPAEAEVSPDPPRETPIKA